MSNRKAFLGANWKMNPTPIGWDGADSPYRSTDAVDVVIFPTALDLRRCAEKKFTVGAQCARPEANGAFTGDIAMQQVKAAGCTHVLCGHSERRQHHEESDAFVALQVASALENGLTPVLCIGENADQREMGETKEVIAEQLLAVSNIEGMIVAYEPVWAIGTGKTPTANEANETHSFIRSLLRDKSTQIIYGGSMNASNAAEFLAQPDIDGGLIGGASLKPEEFRKIVEEAVKI